MSSWGIAITGMIYAFIAIDQTARGFPQLGVVFGGYALSNVGLWLISR